MDAIEINGLWFYVKDTDQKGSISKGDYGDCPKGSGGIKLKSAAQYAAMKQIVSKAITSSYVTSMSNP